MPIRINLLAEVQAEEEARRKDPVKRMTLGAAVLVTAVALWCGILQLKIFALKANSRGLDIKWQDLEPTYLTVAESQRELMESEKKLAALESLRTNRFNWGTVLDAFQQTMKGVDSVRVVRIKGEQVYKVTGGTPPGTGGESGTPGQAVEQISISVEALDASNPPGGQVNRFKESILAVPYFQAQLQKTNGVLLTSLSPPQVDNETGSQFVKFTLQCHFPEKVR